MPSFKSKHCFVGFFPKVIQYYSVQILFGLGKAFMIKKDTNRISINVYKIQAINLIFQDECHQLRGGIFF